MKKIINCDLCGTPCTIEGDDKEGTHYYVPVKTDKDKLISELEKELALYKKALYILARQALYFECACHHNETDLTNKNVYNLIDETLSRADKEVDTKSNLCDTCKKDFAVCDSNPKFGNGVGNDNIYECDAYEEFKDAD